MVIDDSIVRGTTLRESIIRILARLEPKKIVIVSSAPQIRYPDFYGIDMSNLTDFIAFQACVALIEERGMGSLMENIYQEALQSSLDDNPVRRLYEPFTAEEISAKMAQLLRPSGVDIPMEFIFQSMEGLHKAIPNHPGDWYFSGHYPTPGGNRMIKRVFVKFYQEYMQRGKE